MSNVFTIVDQKLFYRNNDVFLIRMASIKSLRTDKYDNMGRIKSGYYDDDVDFDDIENSDDSSQAGRQNKEISCSDYVVDEEEEFVDDDLDYDYDY